MYIKFRLYGILSCGAASAGVHHELVVTPELRKELGPEAPLHRRLKAIRELGEKALHHRIQEVYILLKCFYVEYNHSFLTLPKVLIHANLYFHRFFLLQHINYCSSKCEFSEHIIICRARSKKFGQVLEICWRMQMWKHVTWP